MPIDNGRYNLPINAFAQPVSGVVVQSADAAATLNDLQTAVDALVIGTGSNDSSITNSKLANMAESTIKGRSAGAGAPQDLTVAQARQIMQVPAWADLPFVNGNDAGIGGPGGTDQTAALRTLINSLPAEGGTIYWQGTCQIAPSPGTPLDLTGKRNIRFLGIGGQGTGDSQRTNLYVTSGAIGNGVNCIDMRRTKNVGFEGVWIANSDAAFNGNLLSWGLYMPGAGDDAVFPFLRDCTFSLYGNGRGVWLWGATQGHFRDTKFANSGAGVLVQMQMEAAEGFCNQHRFDGCSFNPGTQYPIVGGGDGIAFASCNFQAGSDGRGRAIISAGPQPLRNLSLMSCTFFDVLTAGGTWVNLMLAEGVGIRDCLFGGTGAGTNYGIALGDGVYGSGADPELNGVKGVKIGSCTFFNTTAAVSFAGTKAAKTNCRGGVIEGNHAVNSAMYSNPAVAENVRGGPNSIHGTRTNFGATDTLLGYLEFADRAAAIAGGLTTGQIFIATGTAGHRVIEIV